MDPKEKEKMAEELNVEETKDTAEEQPQNDQAEEAAPLTHEEQLEKGAGRCSGCHRGAKGQISAPVR